MTQLPLRNRRDLKLPSKKKKDGILKKLNDKGPSRGKWGAPASPALRANDDEVVRRQWGAPPASPTLNLAVEEEQKEPVSSRSQWGEGKNLRLSGVPLEQTSSQMEATSARDQVVKMADAGRQDTPSDGGRTQWGRGSAVVKALDKMPICQDTVNLTDSSSSLANVSAPSTPPVGIGDTITVSSSQPPTVPPPPLKGTIVLSNSKTTSQFKRPLPMPPERSGTIVLSRDVTVERPFNIPVISPLPPAAKDIGIESNENEKTPVLDKSKVVSKASDVPNSDANSGRPMGVLVEVSESQSLSQTQQLKVEEEFAAHLKSMKGQKGKETGARKDGLLAVEQGDNQSLRDGAKSVQMNLSTGLFDMDNITMLRTCSEPDLANLFRTMKPDKVDEGPEKNDEFPPSPIRRHHSLDLTVVPNEDDDFNCDDRTEVDDFAEEDIKLPESDNEEDGEEDDYSEDEEVDIDEDEGEDDDDDMMSMVETMQSLLVESGDEGEQDKKVKFRLSGEGDDLKSKSTARMKSKNRRLQEGISDGGDEHMEAQKDHVDSPRKSDDDNGDDDDEILKEQQELAAALMLGNEEDSDDETTFGDDGEEHEEQDFDRFGRLEQCRMELEAELGIEKLLEVYAVIQKLQEEEDGDLEDGAKVATGILGAKHEHLFPKIFQLVMSDTAFTEDNE